MSAGRLRGRYERLLRNFTTMSSCYTHVWCSYEKGGNTGLLSTQFGQELCRAPVPTLQETVVSRSCFMAFDILDHHSSVAEVACSEIKCHLNATSIPMARRMKPPCVRSHEEQTCRCQCQLAALSFFAMDANLSSLVSFYAPFPLSRILDDSDRLRIPPSLQYNQNARAWFKPVYSYRKANR